MGIHCACGINRCMIAPSGTSLYKLEVGDLRFESIHGTESKLVTFRFASLCFEYEQLETVQLTEYIASISK